MKMESEEIRGILQPLCDDVQEQISYNREERDQWNSKVRKLLDERNELPKFKIKSHLEMKQIKPFAS